ncbi:MAG: hypothetical protein ABI533_01320 [Betaproteobacteria bacterium]
MAPLIIDCPFASMAVVSVLASRPSTLKQLRTSCGLTDVGGDTIIA